ncbi:MAG: MlaA family lipoprotein [Lysobacteraceae bacterium]
MTPSRLLPPVALLATVLLANGCAAHTARPDAPAAAATVVTSTDAPAPAETPASATVDAQVANDAPGVAASTDTVPSDAPPPADTTADATSTADGAGAAPTDAERDFAAIYGGQDPDAYNPVADPTLPPPAAGPTSFDPWEKLNRRVHRFNMVVDRRVAKPLATAYVHVVPRPVRLGVSNFFNNLGQPVSALNALLQGKPKQAGQSAGRFLLNTTLGIGGLFDPATAANLPNRSEDFGQTLGVWGWKRSRYVELPLFGPRTLRDVFGMAGDAPLSPTRQVEDDKARVFLQGLQLVDVRAQLLSTDSFREGAADDYALVRDAWLQRRNYQISEDRKQPQDEPLPDYLENADDAPTVPASAMPLPNPPR